MTLIRRLSNSPSHRPTSSEVHQRVSAVAAEHPPSFANRVEMLERIKVIGEEKDSAIAEKDLQISELITDNDAAVRDRQKILAELEESQSKIDSLHEAHLIELEGLHIQNSDLRADIEHLQTTLNARDQEVKSLVERYKNEQETLENEIKMLNEHHAQQLTALEVEHCSMKQATEKHQVQLELKMSEISSKDNLITSKSSTIQSLHTKLERVLEMSSSKDSLSVFTPGMKLTFTECAKLPKGGVCRAIVVGKDVYIYLSNDSSMLKYSSTEDVWSPLPETPVQFFRIAYLYRKLLLVGGQSPSNKITGDIHEFDEATQQWVRSTTIPPMPTARTSVTAVSWTSPPALIACGGRDQWYKPTTVVEIYHSRTSQWHTASPLPFPRAVMTHTIIHDAVFLVGGYEGMLAMSCKRTVFSASIPQLLESCLLPSRTSPIQWQSLTITDVHNFNSTAASLGGCLLVMGGTTTTLSPKAKDISSSIHAYCPSSSSWVLVGELPQPCYYCTTATLPTGELLVMGGVTDRREAVNALYKTSLSMRA